MKEPCLTAKMLCIVFVFCAATAIASPAQVLTVLYSFCAQSNCSDGGYPYAGLVQASDGNFYGTTGGLGAVQTVFKITPSGTLTTLHTFAGRDGAEPLAGLVEASDGNFYGTTNYGGANGYGTVFRITPGGRLTTLYSFCSQSNCSDGAYPQDALVEASDGNFYGTTYSGGASNNCTGGCGTVFEITPGGTLTTLHSFAGSPSDGAGPVAGLVQASDGNFYGTTFNGGDGFACAGGCGTVFKITPTGTLTTLYNFVRADGASPLGGLLQASDGNFYGTTIGGGAHNEGTVFRMSPNGALTTLYSFCSQSQCVDGALPWAERLVQASNGNFYGTTKWGGVGDLGTLGTVFKITPSGALTTLHTFAGGPGDGADPIAGLVQATDGNFYGTTSEGGANGAGTVFRLVLPRACVSCRSVE